MSDPATLIGLLADEDRLRVFSAVALGAGLLGQDDGLHVALDELRDAARRRPDRERGAADATADEQRVLRNFVVDGRLVRLPARHAQKQIVLGYVARRFDESRSYEEREVNELLRGFHDDTASLRRYLVDEGLLEREAGVYRRA